MRLIDADALRASMYHEAFENDASYDEKNPLAKWDSGLWVRYKMFESCLESAPSMDAVPVIRCKDCKHKNDCFSEVAMTNKYQTTTLYEPIEWCSKAERKEE